MRFSRWLAMAIPLLPAFGLAADPPPEADGVIRVPLKLVETDRPNNYEMAQLKNGKGEITFPNALGKLKLEYQDNRLWVDSNGDGKITRAEDGSSTGMDGGSLKAAALLGGREVMLPIRIMQATREMAYLGTAGALQGATDGLQFRLVPRDGSAGGDIQFSQIQVATDGNFDNVRSQSYARTMDVQGKLYETSFEDKGWTLKLTPYTGPVGLVSLKLSEPANDCDVTLTSVDKQQVAQISSKSAAACVPGEYRVTGLHLAKNETAGRHVCIGGQHARDAPTITISEGENVVALGGPFTLDFTATAKDGQVEVTDVWAMGASGVRHPASAANKDGQVFAAYVRAGDREQEITKLAYG